MKKSDLNALRQRCAASGICLPSAAPDLEIHLLRVLDLAGTTTVMDGGGDPFAGEECQPDRFKAYCDFQICHSFPQITGPTMSGSFFGYHPRVLAGNHKSLLHQWMNLNHRIKADNPKVDDRIVGCVIATHFPAPPPAGWNIPATAAEAPCITARAVLYKQANGMDRVLGKQQTGRQDWKVSIEADADVDNIGVYDPGNGAIYSWDDVPDALLDAVSLNPAGNGLLIGRVGGRQLAFAYGGKKGQVHFRGVGMTTTPAEKTARILSIRAEGGEFFRIAAEGAEEDLLIGRRCFWDNRQYSGHIAALKKEGFFVHPQLGMRMSATEEDPAVKIYLSDNQVVLKRFSSLYVE